MLTFGRCRFRGQVVKLAWRGAAIALGDRRCREPARCRTLDMRNRTQVVIPAMRRGQAIGRDCSRGIVLDADALQGERPYKMP